MKHYWQARLVAKGPFVGVATWYGPPWIDGEEVDRSPRWQALVGTDVSARAILMGDEVPIEVDGVGLRNVERIQQHEYEYLVAHAGWAAWINKHFDRPHPAASPRKPIDKRGKSVW